MNGDFLELLRQSKRLHEAEGRSSGNAYEDAGGEEGIYSSLLSSVPEEEPILPPELPEEEERILLGALPSLPEEPRLQVEEEEDCVSILDSILSSPNHFAPSPITEEFAFYKPVQQCGVLYDVYKAMKLALRDGKYTEVILDGQAQSISKNVAGAFYIDHPKQNLKYVSEDGAVHYGDVVETDHTFFWVMGERSRKVLGYCHEGWVYKMKESQ